MSTQEHEKSPLEIAQTKYTLACKKLNIDSPSKQQTKDVLQQLIDEETDFQVKFAFTQIWHLAKDYYR